MKRLLFALLCPLTLAAQTPVTIQNASFETHNTFDTGASGPCAVNDYNLSGPIPSWAATGSGYFGSWQPCSAFFTSIPDGSTIAFTNGPTLTQDLGVTAQANGTYTLNIYVGRRLDSVTGVALLEVLAGATSLCSLSVDSSALSPGTFAKETITCSTGSTVPTGDLTVSLGCSGSQCSFDNINLIFTPGPPKFTFGGSGGGVGFTVTMLSGAFTAPTCGPNDGKCSLSLQYTGTLSCDTASPPNCQVVTPGTLSWVKTFNGGQQVIFIATLSSP